MSLYIGIDVGGTSIKGALIDGEGKLYGEDCVRTGNGMEIVDGIVAICNRFTCKSGGEKIKGVGIGCAGVIDSENGTVVFSGNLRIKDFPLAKLVEEKVKLPVKITNDANAAALGEAKFGAGKEYSDSILVTLGTGVGGGIIIDGKLFEGGKSAGTEIGHTVIETNGYPCTCGRWGCFECYASATALMRKTKDAMEEDTGSEMWKTYTPQTVSGKTPFEYAETDIAAKQVVDWYVKHLACGITNLANVFRPQVVMLGGGVSEQGERLTVPVQRLVDKELFAGTDFAPVKVVKASLGSRAGAYGAAALWME